MKSLTIDQIREVLQTISPVQCDYLSENAIVALEKYHHSPEVKLIVSGDTDVSFELKWNKQVNMSGYQNHHSVVAKGAEGVSFLLALELTGYEVIEEAVIGTGIDYWMGYGIGHKNYQERNFLRARLEISGIGHENSRNKAEKRWKEKKKQSAASDKSGLPVYISIVEFSSPKAVFFKK
jgi:hypothetical protein